MRRARRPITWDMTVSSVGSSGASATEIAELQKQLKTDQQKLSDDTRKRAQAATLAADSAKVLEDQQAIAAAQARAKQAKSGGESSGQDQDGAQRQQAAQASGASANASTTGGVDVTVS